MVLMQRDSEEWRGRCGQVLRAASWVEGAQGGLLIDLYDVPENCFSKAYAKPGNWFRPGLPAKGPEVDWYRSPSLEGGRLGLSPSSAPTNYRASAKSPEVSVSLPVKSGAFATLTVCARTMVALATCQGSTAASSPHQHPAPPRERLWGQELPVPPAGLEACHW